MLLPVVRDFPRAGYGVFTSRLEPRTLRLCSEAETLPSSSLLDRQRFRSPTNRFPKPDRLLPLHQFRQCLVHRHFSRETEFRARHFRCSQ
jgi:hypothetical protein